MSLLGRLKRPGPSGFGHGSTASQVTEGLDLSGRSFLVTGCTSGIGLESCRVLAERGAHLFALGRSVDKVRRELGSRLSGSHERYVPLACELTDLASVRAAVEAVRADGRRLDGLVANAGIMALPRLERVAGYEKQFFTNHVGHFVLVTGLLDRLSARGRVVVVSSEAHRMTPRGGIDFDNLDGRKGYSPFRFYGQSKLANLLFTRELARRLPEPTQSANAVHPGVIATNLGRHMPALVRVAWQLLGPLFMKSVAEGAATETYVATHPAVRGINGSYFSDCNVASPSPTACDDALARRLWEVTEAIVKEVG